ncbi:MAG: hypothetical protein ACXAC5_19225 [Promethearchaeota archaeon]|jgi:hypothetical protein
MSKFLENIRGKIKKLPSLFVKRFITINVVGDLIEITFPSILISHTVKEFLEDLIIKIDNNILYDINLYPSDFDVKLNNNLVQNQNLSEIYNNSLKIGDKLEIIIPNRFNITVGTHNIVMETPSSGKKVSFERYISSVTEKTEESKPQIVQRETSRRCNYCNKEIVDPNQVICEYCGSELKN